MAIDKMFGPVEIATSGLRAQNKNMEVIYSNIANAKSTDAGDGKPYRRLEALFKAQKEDISGVTIDEIVPDKSDFVKILDPGHPKADKDGYVMMPNVNLPTELISLNLATRAYQANVAILKRYQRMVENTLELLR